MACGNTGFITADEARRNARNYRVIYTEICAIQQAIITSMENFQYEAIVNNNTTMTSTAGIISVTVTNGGSDYDPVSASGSIVHSNGTNATVELTLTGGTISDVEVTNGGSGYEPISATVSSIDRITNIDATLSIASLGVGGSITGITITDGGQGYHVGDELSITDGTLADISVSAIDAMGTITAVVITTAGSGYLIGSTITVGRITPVDAALSPIVSNDGEIESITITTAGAAYHVGDQINISHPNGVGAVIQVGSISATGAITDIDIIVAGSDYQTEVATIEIDHPTGIGFSASVTVESGEVTAVVISNGGIGYNDLYPTVTVTDPTGSGATFDITLDSGAIDSIEVLTKGSNYTQGATLTIVAAPTSLGAGATATATIETTNVSSQYYNVYNNIVTGREIDDQIDYILSYFTNLGYNIRLQTNPSTQNTLQWYILW